MPPLTGLHSVLLLTAAAPLLEGGRIMAAKPIVARWNLFEQRGLLIKCGLNPHFKWGSNPHFKGGLNSQLKYGLSPQFSPLRPLVAALFAVLLGSGGCAALEVKSSASVQAEQIQWTRGLDPKVVAKVAVECSWRGGPAQ